ncbi:MAG: hypothetical protein Kow0029_01390 [Candidatus Rifleibacteriota bacterium]
MDPVKDFFADLKSPDPSIRFSVLSRIEDLAWDEQQRSALKKLISEETDPGIRFHMQKVLARLESKETSKASAADIEKLLKNPERDEITLALMLESVKSADAALVIDYLREARWTSFSPQLLPSVLKFLKKYGSFEDSADIERLCRHHDPRVLSSAIEALEKISPDRLKDLIVPLLVNPNFGIRSRAVRLLHQWDPNEALRHFEAMLFSPVESEKQAALFHAFFFPFKQIETLMLRFISVEKDAELITKAGLLFMANPNGQSPARLLEARQASTGEKFNLIDGILKGVLTSLYQAKIVNATPEKMLEILENHFREKRIKLYIERYSLGLKSGAVETRFKSAIKLCDLIRYDIEEAKEIVSNFLKKEKNEELKAKVLQYFAGCLPGKTYAKEKVPDKFDADSFHDHLINVNQESFPQIIKLAEQNFKDLAPQDQVLAIKAIEQFGNKANSQLPAKLLKSENAELLTAAIDCLSKIDPDQLLPYLPQLIKHNSDEVRESAIKVFSMFDKEQAIALVEKMLFSVQPVQRRQGILCISHFDFQSVSHLLLRAIRTEGDPENQQQICSILRSNADEELFYKLYADWKACKSTKKELYEEICNTMAEQLSTGENAISKQKLYEVAIDKLEEEEKAKQQRQAYKLEKIQKIRENTDKKFTVDPGLVRFTIVAYSIGAVLTVLIWFLFLAPSQPVAEKRSKNRITRDKNSETSIVKGTVTFSDEKKRVIELENLLENRKIYRIVFPDSYGKLPEVGEKFHAQVKVSARDKQQEKVSAIILAAF